MPLVPFSELMSAAEHGNYAVGYFESWNLESLLAIADAAEAARSPVILGFSGIYLPHPGRAVHERLSPYAALGLDVCRNLSVPACFLFNESPDLAWVMDSIRLGFNLVMFSDEELGRDQEIPIQQQVVAAAHAAGVAVEAELAAPPGLSGHLAGVPEDLDLSEPGDARAFLEQTGVDALAVNIGQAHLHGRQQVGLRLDRLAELRAAVPVPLVLHGASSVLREDLAQAARQGIRKVNVGSVLKRRYLEATRAACNAAGTDYNPYEAVGSGFAEDILVAGRLAVQEVAQELMEVFGSTGRV